MNKLLIQQGCEPASICCATPTLASIAVLLFVGVVADRTSRKRVIYSSELLAMTAQFAMAFALLGGYATVPLLTDAVSFAVSAILVFTLRPRPQQKPEPASVFEDLRLGWREFTSHTWLWVIVIQFSLIVAASEAVFGLIGPAVAREQMGGAVAWGFIASGFGVGTLMGGIAAMRVNPLHPMRFATCCVFFFASVHLALAVPLAVGFIVCAAFIGGFTGQLFAVLWYTTLQTRVPAHLLSRVSAYDHVGSIALAPLGIVVGGILFESIGYRSTLIIAALTVIIPTLITLSVRDVWSMTRN